MSFRIASDNKTMTTTASLPQRRQSGFVLVMVLVVLGLAGVVLASIARYSCHEALEAVDARQGLQLRWGTLSCKDAFLGQAERMLELSAKDSKDSKDTPAVSAMCSVRLGGMSFDVKVSDEQAKVNLNMLAFRQPDNADALVAQLAGRQKQGIKVLLQPAPAATEKLSTLSAFPLIYRSYDQVFDYELPSELFGTGTQQDLEQELATDYVTCWGSGLVNYHRAPVETLRIAAAGVLTEEQLDKLEKFLKEKPNSTLQEVAKHLALPSESSSRPSDNGPAGRPGESFGDGSGNRPGAPSESFSEKDSKNGSQNVSPKIPGVKTRNLKDIFVEKSTCHSIWVVARDKGRSWYRLSVEFPGDAKNDAQRPVFAW